MVVLRFGLLILCVCSISLSYAQPKKIRVGGKKCSRVVLYHPELLMAAHEITDSEIQDLLQEGVKSKIIDDILIFSQETNWPEQTRNLQIRMNQPDSMQAYVLYELAATKNWHVLIAPQKFNRSRSSGWALQHSIYFIVPIKAISP